MRVPLTLALVSLTATTACYGLDTIPVKDEDPGVTLDDTAEPQAYGALVLSRSTVDFGEVDPGQSATEDLVLTNEGEEVIELLGVSISGGERFEITSTLVGDIDPGNEQVLSLRFSPNAAGEFEDTLILETDAVDAERVEVALAGTGAGGGGGDDTGSSGGPALVVNPTRFDFGTIDIGQSATGDILLTNNGTSDVAIQSFRSSDAVFGWGGEFSLPYILGAGNSKAATVTYTPTQEVVSSGTVTVVSSDPEHPEIAIQMGGQGYQSCTICQPILTVLVDGQVIAPNSSVDFNFFAGTEHDFQLINEGDQDMTISSVEVFNDLNGEGAAGTFSLQGWGSNPRTIAPFDSVTVTVIYRSSAQSIDLALPGISNYMRITWNHTYDSPTDIGLSGLTL
ncbi:MAG: choice-of-anchor D domain-containing protein [Alphaproteobacteria bacterium]|nr:choice-of-anchor D domain-containing protein [Alphaproteobacteria bacterium]